MKQRLSAMNILAWVQNARSNLVGFRVANIYDLGGKVYIFKFSLSSEGKRYLLLEPGRRIHTTQFTREKNSVPSQFSINLRKFLRTKKLVEIRQCGIDRVVDLCFRGGDSENHLILELYASGNLILTDKDYVILTLLRTHKFDENVKCAVKEKYPFAQAAGIEIKPFSELHITEASLKELYENKLKERAGENEAEEGGEKSKKKKKRGKKNSLKAALQVVVPFINATEAEHCILSVGGTPNELVTEDQYGLLLKAMEYCYGLVNELLKNGANAKGYLYYTYLKSPLVESNKDKEEEKDKKEEDSEEIKIYEEVEPYEFKQVKERNKEEIKTFDEALDIYFTAKEKEREQTRRITKETEIWKKMEKIKQDQENRIKALQEGQEAYQKKAKLIQQYVDEVDTIIKIINTMVVAGMKWADIWKNIKDEKKRGNPFANLIHSIDLLNNRIVVMLNPKEEDEDNEAPTELVDIDITLTAYQNFENYYNEKKKSALKELKTKDAAHVAIKTAEKVAQKELRVEKQKIEKLQKLRKIFWFEKFNWFITSENYLVLSGRTAQENEILVKKYLKKGDLFVHASIHGAAATVIKNPSGNPVSPISLNEAGMYCICRSSAWEQKLVTGAFWVYHHQVSKTAPSGEYLQTGSFMIRGKKNYLYPSKLEMGFTYLFCLDEPSIANHINDRKVRVVEDESLLYGQPTEENVEPEEEPVIEPPVVKKSIKQPQKEKKQPAAKEKEKPKTEERKKANKPLSKHKQKKIKRMKEKYGDLDEEDKELVLKLIGSKGLHIEPQEEKKKPEKAEEENSEEEEKESGSSPDEEPEKVVKKAEDDKEAEEKREKQEVSDLLREESITELKEEEKYNLSEIDSLTGKPTEKDTILFAVPMCAPYSSLLHCSYKIKLQPGTQRKGKAFGTIKELFMRNPEIPPREKEMIKNVTDEECINALIGNIKVVAPGLYDMKAKKQQKKKQQKKAESKVEKSIT